MDNQQQRAEALNAELTNQMQVWENETIFDASLLPDNFGQLTKEVLSFNSPFHLRMSLEFYKQLVTHEDASYSLMEISVICHAAKLRTQRELEMGLDEYLEFQDGIENIAKEYLKITSAKRESLQRKIAATVRAEQGVPDHKKTIKLPAPQS